MSILVHTFNNIKISDNEISRATEMYTPIISSHYFDIKLHLLNKKKERLISNLQKYSDEINKLIPKTIGSIDKLLIKFKTHLNYNIYSDIIQLYVISKNIILYEQLYPSAVNYIDDDLIKSKKGKYLGNSYVSLKEKEKEKGKEREI